MTAPGLAAIAGLLALAPAGIAGAACVPAELVRAIAAADSARLITLPRPDWIADLFPGRAQGTFPDCPGRECLRVSGRPLHLLLLAFGQPESFECGAGGGGSDWSGGETGTLGVEFACGGTVVRMVLQVPGGGVEVGAVGGVRYGARGSWAAARRWRAFIAACAEERHVLPRAFLRGLLKGEPREERPPAGAAPAPADTLCELGGRGYSYVEELPEVVTRVEPELPDLEHVRDREATVLVQALVCRDGRVHDVRVVQSVPLMDEVAVAAVRQWVFEPARENGRPIACWVTVPIHFHPH